jgi:hypothetical protein
MNKKVLSVPAPTKPKLGLSLYLAYHLYRIAQIYWIISIFADLGATEILVALWREGASRQVMSNYGGSIIPGFELFSVIMNGLIIALLIKCRNNWYVKAQRVRIFLAARNWIVAFFILSFSLILFIDEIAASTQVFVVTSIIGIFGVTFGLFGIVGLLFSIPYTFRTGIDYGIPEVLQILAQFQYVPRLLRPKTCTPLLKEAHSVLESLLSTGYPRMIFASLGNDFSGIALCMNIGTDEEKRLLTQFFNNSYRIVVRGRKRPLESSNEFLRELESLKQGVTSVPELQQKREVHGAWTRSWGMTVVNIVRPYSDVIIIALAVLAVILQVVLR